MDNQIKGREYEIQVKHHIINNLNKQAYLWNEVPISLLINSGIIGNHNDHRLLRKEKKENPLKDTGIDIIQKESDTKCSIIQCKNGYKNGVTMKDLAGFICWMFSINNINGYIYYTNKISINLRELPKNERLTYIKHPFIENIKEEISKSLTHYNVINDLKNSFTAV